MERIKRRINRLLTRRYDKLKLLLLMVGGSAVPILLCWTVPSLLAEQREQQRIAAEVASLEADAAFKDSYADLIALCGQENEGKAEPSGQFPPDLKVLLIRSGTKDESQEGLPDAWQPDSPDDVTVVACLGREVAQPAQTCLNGETPDMSKFEGYEQISGLATTFGQKRVHPELSGRVLLRYQTEADFYDARSGALIASTVFWGPDPLVCTDPPEVSPAEYASGQVLLDEVRAYIIGDRAEAEDFIAQLVAFVGQEQPSQ